MAAIQVDRLSVGLFATNCYIVYTNGSNSCVVIDPGDEGERILWTIKNSGLTIRAVLLTHGHIDHLMALEDITSSQKVPVYAHTEEKPILENVPVQSQMFGLPKLTTPKISHWLREGDEIELDGLTFSVLHTPGHSPGGCCYQLPSATFVGDTLFEVSVGRTDLPGGNYHQLIQSIKTKLLSLPDDMILYPGHGDKTTVGHEKQSNPFLTGAV